jgi:hypothetical protein
LSEHSRPPVTIPLESSVSSTPNPARLDQYQAKLAELVAARDSYRAQHLDQKVYALNRQIRAQIKWIRKAVSRMSAEDK